jgi:hypothetical protein
LTGGTKSSTASTTDDGDPITTKILKLVTDLGNTVLAKKAASEINAIKIKKTQHFSSPILFRRVMEILEQHRFHLPVCRFVLDLFDRRVLRRVVFEESDDDDDDEEEELGRPTKVMIHLSSLTLTSGCLYCPDSRVVTTKIRSRHQRR